jgi:hypothetical protein
MFINKKVYLFFSIFSLFENIYGMNLFSSLIKKFKTNLKFGDIKSVLDNKNPINKSIKDKLNLNNILSKNKQHNIIKNNIFKLPMSNVFKYLNLVKYSKFDTLNAIKNQNNNIEKKYVKQISFFAKNPYEKIKTILQNLKDELEKSFFMDIIKEKIENTLPKKQNLVQKKIASFLEKEENNIKQTINKNNNLNTTALLKLQQNINLITCLDGLAEHELENIDTFIHEFIGHRLGFKILPILLKNLFKDIYFIDWPQKSANKAGFFEVYKRNDNFKQRTLLEGGEDSGGAIWYGEAREMANFHKMDKDKTDFYLLTSEITYVLSGGCANIVFNNKKETFKEGDLIYIFKRMGIDLRIVIIYLEKLFIINSNQSDKLIILENNFKNIYFKDFVEKLIKNKETLKSNYIFKVLNENYKNIKNEDFFQKIIFDKDYYIKKNKNLIDIDDKDVYRLIYESLNDENKKLYEKRKEEIKEIILLIIANIMQEIIEAMNDNVFKNTTIKFINKYAKNTIGRASYFSASLDKVFIEMFIEENKKLNYLHDANRLNNLLNQKIYNEEYMNKRIKEYISDVIFNNETFSFREEDFSEKIKILGLEEKNMIEKDHLIEEIYKYGKLDDYEDYLSSPGHGTFYDPGNIEGAYGPYGFKKIYEYKNIKNQAKKIEEELKNINNMDINNLKKTLENIKNILEKERIIQEQDPNFDSGLYTRDLRKIESKIAEKYIKNNNIDLDVKRVEFNDNLLDNYKDNDKDKFEKLLYNYLANKINEEIEGKNINKLSINMEGENINKLSINELEIILKNMKFILKKEEIIKKQDASYYIDIFSLFFSWKQKVKKVETIIAEKIINNIDIDVKILELKDNLLDIYKYNDTDIFAELLYKYLADKINKEINEKNIDKLSIDELKTIKYNINFIKNKEEIIKKQYPSYDTGISSLFFSWKQKVEKIESKIAELSTKK